MVVTQFIRSQEQLEDEIRQDVIEVRRFLPQCGYREVAVFKEGRRGLLYCALWERTAELDERPGAVGYGRVSTILQSDNHSLVTQIRQQLELAEERGHVIRYIYVDAGFTGRDDRRPAFSHMIRHIARDNNSKDKKQIHFNYIYDVYRFYRNLNGLTTHYALLQKNNVELVSTADKNTDYGSRDGKILLYLKGIMGELYLDDLSRNTRDNKYSRALDGYSNASQPPFGYCRGNCLDCTDPNGQGYCPRFGGPDLWRELGDDRKVFVPTLSKASPSNWLPSGMPAPSTVMRTSPRCSMTIATNRTTTPPCPFAQREDQDAPAKTASSERTAFAICCRIPTTPALSSIGR